MLAVSASSCRYLQLSLFYIMCVALRGHIDIHKVNTGIAAFSDVACW